MVLGLVSPGRALATALREERALTRVHVHLLATGRWGPVWGRCPGQRCWGPGPGWRPVNKKMFWRRSCPHGRRDMAQET